MSDGSEADAAFKELRDAHAELVEAEAALAQAEARHTRATREADKHMDLMWKAAECRVKAGERKDG